MNSKFQLEINNLKKQLCCANNVLFYENFVSFPTIGIENRLYIDKTTRTMYIWTGIIYQTIL